MKKLLTTILSATAILFPLTTSANTTHKVEQSVVQPEKAKGIWIDVRSAEEFNSGHLQNAINIPHDQIIEGIKAVNSDKNAPINLYCRSGRRAEVALNELKKAGYTNVTNHGGYDDLVKKGLK
ncbi:rhodanese-like domain-containing protein [Haemophilus haemolyticus]|uniref:Rhodanese-like domain-containing protein n=1 Tax=Haemophilus haemolyticus TaxID=726 RepID=A0A502JK35_HAEHA|nr:rhodanese-like domain-containing protein [Haemophilus haemolyticus]NYA25614.1 rhodanese-like domain-containing protein [Haemophilus haemolyticus]TPG98574.1 rhodanese-like domain-containing protein [Haemophilus haemolyticus]